jgi:hypothetical protein
MDTGITLIRKTKFEAPNIDCSKPSHLPQPPQPFLMIKAVHTIRTVMMLLAMTLLTQVGWGQTPYRMSDGDKTWDFADLSNWGNNFANGIGAANWGSVGVIGSGNSVTTGTRTTKSSATFVSNTTGGLQKGNQALLFLSTGSNATPEAVAVDLYLNFSGRNAGTLSFDYVAIDNSAGTRPTSLRVFWSIDGITFTEITDAQVLDLISSSSGSITSIALPSGFNNSSTARLRFYNHAGSLSGSGNRDKFQIDNIAVTSTIGSPLPVFLLSFSGYKDGIRNQLRWVTSSEINNRGFQVERSSDGQSYQSIGFVNSLAIGGNSQTPLKYSFSDAQPAGVKQYYRLKQTDIDGRNTLSNILLIQGEKPTAFEIASVFPNPTRGQITMLLSAPTNETVNIRVMDLAGRILETRQVNVLTGNNSIPFDLSKQAKGQYLIQVGEKTVRVVSE